MSFAPGASEALPSPPQSEHKDVVWQLCWLDTAPVPPVQLAISSTPEDWSLSAWLISLHVGQITYMYSTTQHNHSNACCTQCRHALEALDAKDSVLGYFLQVPSLTSPFKRPYLPSCATLSLLSSSAKGFIAGSFTPSLSLLNPCA